MGLQNRLLFLPFAILAAFLVLLPVSGEEIPESAMLAPAPHPHGYVCYRVQGPITIDGKIDDPAWEAAPWSEDFVDIEGDKQRRPRFRTRMKMLWDDEALYIAAELEEPHVWATLTEHDSVIFIDNDFEVFIDPDGDNHLYGELEVNARNTNWDLLLTKPYKDKGKAVQAWEIRGLKTAVHVNGTLNDPRDVDRGWTVEIKWPWTGLKELTDAPVPPHEGNQWRINFSRVEWDMEIVDGKYRKLPKRPEHNWVWSPQGVIDMHRPERWGYVQFSAARSNTVQFQPNPDWASRDLLHRVYYAERAYFKAHGKYANTVADLGLKLKEPEGITLETTRSGFEASLPLPRNKEGKSRRLSIAQDSLIWVE